MQRLLELKASFFWFFLLIVCFSKKAAAQPFDASYVAEPIPPYEEELVKSRLETLESIVKPRYTTTVEGYIKEYVLRNRPKAERILGRSLLYFPLFEKYLKEHHLPLDLKYLAVVESALDPLAVSKSGAAGLWQFMKETGESYGLNVNHNVDERSDPNKSTVAALKHLAKQYERFGRWELALAAYNSGAGRVKRAIRMAGSKNFWRVMRFLPKETRSYVPAFIGATYLLHFYKEHDLTPQFPELDRQLTGDVTVFGYLPLARIAEVCGLSEELIESLNPSFKKGFVPGSPAGTKIILPKRVLPALEDFLNLQQADRSSSLSSSSLLYGNPSSAISEEGDYQKSIYVVAKGDKLERLAKLFGCQPYHLLFWNHLASSELKRGQELVVYRPKNYRRHDRRQLASLPFLPLDSFADSEETDAKNTTKSADSILAESTTCYTIKRYESLLDIAAKFPGLKVAKLIQWNGINQSNPPLPGTKIIIKPAE